MWNDNGLRRRKSGRVRTPRGVGGGSGIEMHGVVARMSTPLVLGVLMDSLLEDVGTFLLGNATDAEDVAQECFLELMQARATIRLSLAAWLHTRCIQH